MPLRPHPRPSGGRPQSPGASPLRPTASILQSGSLIALQTNAGVSDSTPDASSFDVGLMELTALWERGEPPRLEDYLDRLHLGQPTERVELIYHEFCLSRWAGLDPRPDDYLRRFPAEAEALGRLLRVDAVLGSASLRLWDGPPAAVTLPEVGDEIGPYRLIRQLGRGAFARVFLAEQADLDDRLVVVKVSTRLTPEPSLLARASHPHIVQVLWHGEADGGSLQLICMPFQGGATLSAVLAERRRRGPRPGLGRSLLDDLDRVSAVGYLPPCAGGPARESIACLSYPGATAWVVARLAEALDFAYARGVLHGDVKPSNVLMTADGTPMLFDFNLAVGWQPHGALRPQSSDIGGTLAYMAPERLRAVADPARALLPTVAARHRADIYSLGVLLLEMLTCRAPEIPEGGRPSLQELAKLYVLSREHGGGVMIRSAGIPLPAALRSVLERCLAPDPADRYGRASELAEDLDRWRADLPLAFAREPGRALALLRSARRRRRVLATLATGLAFAAVATAFAWQRAETELRERAAWNYSQIVDSEESGAFRFRRRGIGPVKVRGNPAEVAKRNLDRYGVLETGGNWRQRDEFRMLPLSDRNDLEALLLEQALRFAHTLGERPSSPSDWQRALIGLEQVTATSPCDPLEAECRTLRRKLEQPELPSGRDTKMPASPPGWMVEYLLGVEAELQDRPHDAIDHYKTVLTMRPGTFWANYRLAVVACEEEQYAEGVKHLRFCVEQRPDNPALRRQFAGCLYMDHRDQEAMEQCDKAQGLSPDAAETYVTRSFLRIALKQFDNFVKDIDHYDVLKGHRVRRSSETPHLDLMRTVGGSGDNPEGDELGHRQAGTFDPDEFLVRHNFANELSKAGQYETALGQYDRLLEMNPDDLLARFNIVALRHTLKGDDTDREFALIAQHPRIETLVRNYPQAISAFHKAVPFLTREGRLQEALQTAEMGVRLADRHEVMQADSYFLLARVYALLAKTDASLDRDALEHLRRAYHLSPRFVQAWCLHEPAFDDLLAEYGVSAFQAR